MPLHRRGLVGRVAYAEVAIGYAILAAGCPIGLRGLARLVGLAVLAVGAYASFRFPAYHFVVLTHLHNLVPLVFLWDWAARLRTPAMRLGFRLTQVLWIVVLPLLILAGLANRWISAAPGSRSASSATADGERLLRGPGGLWCPGHLVVAPPGVTTRTPTWSSRCCWRC